MEVAVVAAVLTVVAEVRDAVLAAATRRDRKRANYSFDRSPCIDFLCFCTVLPNKKSCEGKFRRYLPWALGPEPFPLSPSATQ